MFIPWQLVATPNLVLYQVVYIIIQPAITDIPTVSPSALPPRNQSDRSWPSHLAIRPSSLSSILSLDQSISPWLPLASHQSTSLSFSLQLTRPFETSLDYSNPLLNRLLSQSRHSKRRNGIRRLACSTKEEVYKRFKRWNTQASNRVSILASKWS